MRPLGIHLSQLENDGLRTGIMSIRPLQVHRRRRTCTIESEIQALLASLMQGMVRTLHYAGLCGWLLLLQPKNISESLSVAM